MLLYDLTPRSEGMFIQSGDFVNEAGMNNNSTMTFYGQDNGKYLFFTCAQEPIRSYAYSFDCAAVILEGMVILMLSCIEESLKLIKELMFFHRIIFKICIYYITQVEKTCIN